MTFVEKRIKTILDSKHIPYRIHEHEPVYTSEQAAQVRGVELKTGVKALIMKTQEGKLLLVLVRADKRADLKRIAVLEGTRKIHLASPEEVLKHAGCEIGSVPPFGHTTQLKTYMDREILGDEQVNFNIGSHTKSISMKAQDLLKVMSALMY